jgi:hypothetical protein
MTLTVFESDLETEFNTIISPVDTLVSRFADPLDDTIIFDPFNTLTVSDKSLTEIIELFELTCFCKLLLTNFITKVFVPAG